MPLKKIPGTANKYDSIPGVFTYYAYLHNGSIDKLGPFNKDIIAIYVEGALEILTEEEHEERQNSKSFPKNLLGSTPLFMGNGEHSSARCFELVSDLMESFSNLSTLQQMPTSSETHEKCSLQVELTAAKIYFSLTGRVPK